MTPWIVCGLAILAGIASGEISLRLENLITSLDEGPTRGMIEFAVEAPLVEETAKVGLAATIIAIAWSRRWIVRSATGAALVGALVGAGFGAYEGFFDAANHWNQLGWIEGLTRALGRTIAGGLHVLTTGALAFAVVRFREGARGRAFAVGSAAVLYHALNNAHGIVEIEYGWSVPLVNLTVYSWAFLFYFLGALLVFNRVDVGPRTFWQHVVRFATSKSGRPQANSPEDDE